MFAPGTRGPSRQSPSAEIRNNVTVEILRTAKCRTVSGRITNCIEALFDDHVLSFNLGMSITDFVKALQKQSVRDFMMLLCARR